MNYSEATLSAYTYNVELARASAKLCEEASQLAAQLNQQAKKAWDSYESRCTTTAHNDYLAAKKVARAAREAWDAVECACEALEDAQIQAQERAA